MEHQQKEVVAFQIAEPIYNLSVKMMKTCNPKTLDKKYLKDFKIRPNETLVTLNSTQINPNSPKTAKALQDCNFLMNQLELLQLVIKCRDKQEFRIKNETSELQDKRYWIHYFQIAQRRKEVILQRNKYKREEWLEKQQQQRPNHLDVSLNSSINISEYAPYKSPTEMIESWIDSHKQQSDRQLQKFSQIQQKRKEQEEFDEEEKIKYKEKLDAIIEKKTKNRENNLKLKQQIAKKDVSKSLEISTKMKTVILEEKYKKAEQRKLQTEQHIEKAQERVHQMKEQYVNVLEEKQKIYEDKLHQVLKKKEDQDSQLMQSRVKDVQTERSQKRKSKLKKNEWSLKLPALISRSQAQLQSVYNSNLSSVIEKFKKEEKKKLRTNKSLEQEKEESDKIKHKEEQFTKRWSQKLKQFEDRLEKVQQKFAKKDQYLQEHTQKKKEELEEKFEKIRELSAENERRFVHIKQEYSNKCDQQMDKEIKKFKQNMHLLKQREQIIEQLRHKRFMEKNKSSLASLQGDSISKHSEQ